MSRSGYSDECDDPLALGRWRQAVQRAIEGKRGQAMLRELLAALEAMPEKRLAAGNFATPEGEFCTLGVLGAARGVRMDDLGDADDCDPALVGERFGIARALAAEIMWLNDEAVDSYAYAYFETEGPMRPAEHRRTVSRLVHLPNVEERRWQAMHDWVREQLKDAP